MAADGRTVTWIVSWGDQRLNRVDIDTNEVIRTPIDAFPWTLIVADGSLWVGHHAVPRARRSDPETFEELAGLPFDTNPRGLAFGGGLLWVATENSLHTVDPATDEVTRTIEFGPFPSDTGPIGLAYLDGDVSVSIE